MTAVEWLEEQVKSKEWQDMFIWHKEEVFDQAKEMEKEQSYSYDEMRTIAYNAYCLGQLDEPTEGKYNLWIKQFRKK